MPGTHQLADLLQALKERSGRSYSALAQRTGLSRSSVHRYCQGLTVPASFGVVERIARVCGAERDELDRLYAAWVRAAAEEPEVPEVEVPGPEVPEAAVPEPEVPEAAVSEPEVPEPEPRVREPQLPDPQAPDPEEPQPPSLDAKPPRRTSPLLAAALALTLITLAALAYATFAPTPKSPPKPQAQGPAQQLSGPDWHMAPQKLDPAYFGMTMNTDTGQTPDFRVGGLRLWDGETRWGQVEPERGEFEWSVLERLVEGAERADLPVLFTFGGTPGWAAPDSPRTLYTDGTRTAPPDDLADWDRFVTAVVTRYQGRIAAYELWDNVGASSHYSGDMRTLAEMVRRAARIIERIDPRAAVACPSFGGLWEREGQELLREFARTGAYDVCDAAAMKLHPRRADGPPEEIVDLARTVQDDILYGEGVGITLWNTGPGRDIVTRPALDARRAQDYAVRFYLAGLLARRAELSRMYFYSWGGTRVPLVVQAVGGAPTEAGRRIGRLQEWISGTRITSCGRGERVGLPKGVHECRFVRGNGKEWRAVRWTRSGTATTELEPGVSRLHHLDGTSEPARPGERIVYGETPVLVEYGAP
ncbi:helix-turn-helix domain-containing protein [Streptomyces sp. LHD-70]|uniref:helix-turn-helix domain-containing protein n=1 Tax=Streptomyces sp. LHD-70 TaxID=3072140 RepID=UPI00280E5A2B|nr:helix-turn-helix domain-containing protein [Streptomyces sp. LHD-70]MDQ8701052.1 helix-turn-helix domain-containing protein [Streptomyces sp. LHD-70]